ncbi:MAG: hypothetical protein ABW072_18610 [Sedimenticola sp.]
MARNYDFDACDYLDEDDFGEIEVKLKQDKRHRSYDARREIERRLEIKRLKKILDYDDYPDHK